MNDELYYSTSEDVIEATGVEPKNFKNIEDEDELIDLVKGWLVEIKDLIDQDRNRNYHTEDKIPKGIHSIARRACMNMVFYALQSQRSPVIRIGDWNVRMVEDRIFTKALLFDLHKFPAKPLFRMYRAKITEDEDE